MAIRLLNPLHNNSFFLFGARGTGKTTLIRELLKDSIYLYLDILDKNLEYRLSRDATYLSARIDAMPNPPEWVVIDEVQKIPSLLDAVHQLIEERNLKFILTGSSARKLKRGGANLLAGRAFVFHLYPFTAIELAEQFSLESALHWGTLPRLCSFSEDTQRELFLDAYCSTYLQEEIIAEQLVRNLTPFRHFLEVIAQMNGEPINYSRLARDVAVDDSTVKAYFEILEDTLIGFRLPAYDKSVRKQQSQSAKFYLFDGGIKRALEQTLRAPLIDGSSAFGKAFEHFIINQIVHLNDYLRSKFKLSYLRTKDNFEIDLVVERPGAATVFIEIKSAREIHKVDLKAFARFAREQSSSEAWVVCREAAALSMEGLSVLPWQTAICKLFSLPASSA